MKESNITNKDILYLLKRGFVKRSDGAFDYIIGYDNGNDGPTYGVTFSIHDKVVYLSFYWGNQYIEEVLSVLEDLPSGKPVRVVRREPMRSPNSKEVWLEYVRSKENPPKEDPKNFPPMNLSVDKKFKTTKELALELIRYPDDSQLKFVVCENDEPTLRCDDGVTIPYSDSCPNIVVVQIDTEPQHRNSFAKFNPTVIANKDIQHNMPCAVSHQGDNKAVFDLKTNAFQPSFEAQQSGWRLVCAKSIFQKIMLKIAGL